MLCGCLRRIFVSNYRATLQRCVHVGGACNLRCSDFVEALLVKSGAMGGFTEEAGGSGCSGWRSFTCTPLGVRLSTVPTGLSNY